MVQPRETILEMIRKIRNDLIFLTDNLYIPKNLDVNFIDEIIKIENLIIPPWADVFELHPYSNWESEVYHLSKITIDKAIVMIDALGGLDLRQYDLVYEEEELLGKRVLEAMKYLNKSYSLLRDYEKLMSSNLNYYLTRLYVYKTQIFANYSIISRIRNLLLSMEFIDTTETDAALTWMNDFEVAFKNGMYCIDFDTELSPLFKRSILIMNNFQSILGRVTFDEDLSSGAYKFSDIITRLAEVLARSYRISSTDFQLYNSKGTFKPFNENKGATIVTDTSQLPYPFVHHAFAYCGYNINQYAKAYDESTDESDYPIESQSEEVTSSNRKIGDLVVSLPNNT
jgi:hypothetical protein